MADALPHLIVDEVRMRRNLDAAGGVARAEGLVTALAPQLGRHYARSLVEGLCDRVMADELPLQEVAAAEPRVREYLNIDQIAAALAPASFSGSTGTFIDRVLRRWQRER